ncbi:MAG: aminotransferase class V-fold PLP-dependent enzyme [Planctomycetota bacterium]|nr:aminotransferase class V-fold PLP-dependent enzyme [Planctomycetota bacterium]
MQPALATLRKAFPVANSWIYFNHAACAPLSEPTIKAVKTFLDEACTEGSTRWDAWMEHREQVRRRVSRLMGAKENEVAFTTSTSQGLITVAEGLNLQPKDEILVVQDDFPANHIPWFRQEKRGAQVVVAPRREGTPTLNSILDHLTENTALVAVPWVLYDTGERIDLHQLGKTLCDHPALFCVDAIQGLGAFPLDVHACHIDFLAADSHKWLLGMEGIGVFYCRNQCLGLLDPPLTGWWSMAEPFATYSPEASLRPDARRFEYGALPTMEIFGLDASIQLIDAAGLETIGAGILELTELLAAGLQDQGWTIHSPLESEDLRSGILSASHPSLPAQSVVEELERCGVSVAARGPGVRFSPHGWNSTEEVNEVLKRIPS